MTTKKKAPALPSKSAAPAAAPKAGSVAAAAASAKASAKPAGGKPTAQKPVVPSGPSAAELQLKAYENAIRLFSAAKLAEARAAFQQATSGPASQIADKARTYAEVCRRRMGGGDVKLVSAEDHFNYGVARLNARDVDEARRHLANALSLQPDADHILFTMALCCAMDGDNDGACANLKRAIDIDPRNRILARQDPEFVALAAHIPGLRSLLSPEYLY